MNVDVSLVSVECFYYKCKFLAHEQLKPILLEQINNSQTEEYKFHRSVSKVDWTSSALQDREWVKIISEPLISYMDVIGHVAGYKEVAIHDIWFQQYKKLDIHPWHVHGQQFVGVYYLELEKNSPKTEYIVPNGKHVMQFDITEGDIVVFPSSLVHRAPLVESDNRKTIISWNFNFTHPVV